jgi:four helix bundle protein
MSPLEASTMALPVYRVSLELIVGVRPLVDRIARSDRNLADQLKRAASSVALNVAEGTEVVGGNQRVRYRAALGSASEIGAALDVAQAWGYVSVEQVQPARNALDRTRAMLHRLTY